jgi:hypothetical protein
MCVGASYCRKISRLLGLLLSSLMTCQTCTDPDRLELDAENQFDNKLKKHIPAEGAGRLHL